MRKTFLESKNSIRKAKNREEKNRRHKNMKQKGKEYQYFISNRQKVYSRELHKNLRGLKRQHPKEYWSILKKSEGSQQSKSKLPLGVFENHFKSLNQNGNQNHDFDPSILDTDTNQELDRYFSYEEVVDSIKNLKNNKSEGVDYIKNEYLKNCPPTVIALIVELFKIILKSGHVPYEWCVGLIIPIFKKKGSPLDPNNYRGITLLSCLGKLFTACMNCRLTKYANTRDIIGEEQAAFREGYNTMDHVFVLNELINIYLNL
jgi:hypothetical protein